MEISLADVCAFLEDSAEPELGETALSGLAPLPPFAPYAAAAPAQATTLMPLLPTPMMAPASGVQSLGAAVVSSDEYGTAGDANDAGDGVGGMSHQCSWPGCGKGFTSRWSLERHMRNHQSTTGEQEQPDSFVERRLRERLKSVQQALEKTREKLSQHARQQEHADADLQEARAQSEAQQAEIAHLAYQNQQMASALPPGVAMRLLSPINLQAAVGGAASLAMQEQRSALPTCGAVASSGRFLACGLTSEATAAQTTPVGSEGSPAS